MADVHHTKRRFQWLAERYEQRVIYICAVALFEGLGDHAAQDDFLRFRETLSWENILEGLRAGADDRESLIRETTLGFIEKRTPPYTIFNRYLPWVARQAHEIWTAFDRSYPNYDLQAHADAHRAAEACALRIQDMVMRFRSIVEWATAERIDLAGYDVDLALVHARNWAAERALAAMPQGEIVYRFEDDWTVQRLATEDQLRAEGHAMQNCLDLEGKTFAGHVYSLRDPKGHPHATMDFVPAECRVVQLRGKQNTWPLAEYTLRMAKFRVVALDEHSWLRPISPDQGEILLPNNRVQIVGGYAQNNASDSSDVFVLADSPNFGFTYPRDVLEKMHKAVGLFIGHVGPVGLSWRALVDHDLFLWQSIPQMIPTRPEDELVGALAAVWAPAPAAAIEASLLNPLREHLRPAKERYARMHG